MFNDHTPGPGKRCVLGMAARTSIPAAEPRDGFELTGGGFRLPFVTERLVDAQPTSLLAAAGDGRMA